jgi:hypothetical protein
VEVVFLSLETNSRRYESWKRGGPRRSWLTIGNRTLHRRISRIEG